MEGLTSSLPLPPFLPSPPHKTYLLDWRRRVGGEGCQGLGGAIAVDFLGQVRGLGLEGGLVVVEDDGAAALRRHGLMLVCCFAVVGGWVWIRVSHEAQVRKEKRRRDAPPKY